MLVTGNAESSESSNGLADLAGFPVSSFPGMWWCAGESDIIHTHFSVPTSLAAPLISRARSKPLIVNAMGADVYDPTRFGALRPALDVINKHWVFRAADAIVVPSTDMLKRLPASVRQKAHVIPYFTDVERFAPESHSKHSTLRLLSVSRLVKRKNLRTSLRTLSHLVSTGMDVSLTIAGDGDERWELQALAQELGVEEHVEFAGFVPDEDLPALYASHDVFVLPSYHEAFGIVFVEALASGLPVVTSDVGGQTDIVTEDVGRTAFPEADDLHAKHIREIADDYERFSRAARERAESHYSADVVLDGYATLYSEVTR